MEKKRNFVIALAVCDEPIVITQPGKVLTASDNFELPLGINFGTEDQLRKYMNNLLDKFFQGLKETDAPIRV